MTWFELYALLGAPLLTLAMGLILYRLTRPKRSRGDPPPSHAALTMNAFALFAFVVAPISVVALGWIAARIFEPHGHGGPEQCDDAALAASFLWWRAIKVGDIARGRHGPLLS